MNKETSFIEILVIMVQMAPNLCLKPKYVHLNKYLTVLRKIKSYN